jgi:erythromycin esterase-like protein
VKLLRQLYGPAERIVLLVHNGHAQRTPMELLPAVRMRTAGTYLAAARGEAGPSSIRHAYQHMSVDVLAAFDGLLVLPTMTPSSSVDSTTAE